MAKVIFENLSKKQAKTLSEWFEGQGEQDAYPWFAEQNVPCPQTDCSRKGGYREIQTNGDVIVYCITPGSKGSQTKTI